MEGLLLHPSGLLSKWGFSDGDVISITAPDDVYDLAQRIGQHELLSAVVRAFLVPAIPHALELEEITCCHNPIRASSMDGIDVSDLWSSTGTTPLDDIDPVVVPWSDVVALASNLA